METDRRKYEIVVVGEFDEGPPEAVFGLLEVTARRGVTAVVIDVVDQSHLNGVLAWFQDRNIAIESVNPVRAALAPSQDGAPGSPG